MNFQTSNYKYNQALKHPNKNMFDQTERGQKNLIKYIFVGVLNLICTILLVSGSGFQIVYSQIPETQIKTTRTIVSEDDLVHLGDLIDIDVLGSFEFDWHGGLTPEGYLDKAEYSGDQIYGLCRGVDEIADSYRESLAKILKNPQVSVKIIDRSNRPLVELLGSVKNPQRFQIKRPVYLNELLILAGGLTENASGDVQIFRPAKLGCVSKKSEIENSNDLNQTNETKIITLKIAELLKGKKEGNPQIYNGDLITILSAEPIYVIGGVRNPKQIPVRSTLSLLRAIDSAGGISKDAQSNKIVIYRRQDGKTNIIEADLEKIKNNIAEDIMLKPFDIVEVGQKSGGKRKYPPVIRQNENINRNISSLPLRIIE